jgi:hypothetical protein
MMMFGLDRKPPRRRGGAKPPVPKVAKGRPRSFSVEFSEDGGATFERIEVGTIKCVEISTGPPDLDPGGELTEGCRIAWTDQQGREWTGVYRFTLGGLASIELDKLPGAIACRVRVRPDTLRVLSDT